MGMMICPTHGKQPFWEVCSHIWEHIESGVIPNYNILPVIETKICDQCFEKYDVQRYDHLNSKKFLQLSSEEIKIYEEIGSNVYDKLERNAICIECVKYTELNLAKKNNSEFPFDPFESTLLYRDKMEIESLMVILEEKFDLTREEGPQKKEDRIFNVIGGGVSYPLLIKFYDVIDKEEQEEVMKVINSYFKMLSKKQRRVIFLESKLRILGGGSPNAIEYRDRANALILRDEIIK